MTARRLAEIVWVTMICVLQVPMKRAAANDNNRRFI